MIRTHPHPHRWRRYVALVLVVVVGFFAAQGEAVDAEQLRFDSSAPGLARFTVPPPVAHAPSMTPGGGTPSSHRSAPSWSLVAVALALGIAASRTRRHRALAVLDRVGSARSHPPPDVRGPPPLFR